MSYDFSTRANIIYRRTYSRPTDEGYETWEDTLERVTQHQRWLWERALNRKLNESEEAELEELKQLQREGKVSLAGRTLWLGGTDISKEREVSQFNCSFTKVETVHDVVDVDWLLKQGCGVGFAPVDGTLNGFSKPIPEVEVIRSERTEKGGREHNVETWDAENKIWTISVGDSAEAWSKAMGKLLAGKYPAKKLVLDFSQIRPAGTRLRGYGWICSGDDALARAMENIAGILNNRAGELLRKIDIGDIINWIGTTLSSRRSAEIWLINYGDPEWKDFAWAKYEEDFNNIKNPQRFQSNNSLVFHHKPSKHQLAEVFDIMTRAGGSEPGIVNAEGALSRAPWFSGVNPCAEILLGHRSLCNLCEVNLAEFKGKSQELHRATYITARANYRQTLVNLEDGILQASWHQNNEYLRLCGVGLTGVVRRNDLTAYDYKVLRNYAVMGAYGMADELGTQRPKNVTTIKPSGTRSKCLDTTEGVHKPLGRYIFNNVNFSKHEPIVPALRDAGYRVFNNPVDPDAVVVTFPVDWSDVEFDMVDGKPVNLEPAVDQLERYKMLMESYVEQNCSITVSYDPDEVPDIVDWLDTNWDSYVAVSFLPRADPTKTAHDLGYPYLPQSVVTKDEFDEYVRQLKPVDITKAQALDELLEDECEGGACPTR